MFLSPHLIKLHLIHVMCTDICLNLEKRLIFILFFFCIIFASSVRVSTSPPNILISCLLILLLCKVEEEMK